MQEENITGDGLVDASQLNAPTPEPTVESVPTEGMTLAELQAALGKTFPTKEAALKSIKDTYSYVGKKTADIEKEVITKLGDAAKTDTLSREIAELRKERFYDKNPQFADPSIRKFIESTGKNPSEVVESPEFKDIFAKISGYDETQKLKTVLETNPRLASSRDSLTKAREMSITKEGHLAELQGQSKDERDSLILNAVKDAYGL